MNLIERERLFRLGYLNLDRNENLDLVYLHQVDSILKSGSGLASFYPDYPQFVNRLSSFFGISPSELTVTCGCTEAIRIAADSSNRCFRVLTVDPTYNAAVDYFRKNGSPVYSIPADTTTEHICKVVRNMGADFVYLCNPNNPTGHVYKELERLCELKATVFIDEAYSEFGPVSAIKLAPQSPNIIVGRSFSKAWGLAGLRIGLAVSNPDTIQKLNEHKLKASVNTVAVRVLSGLLDNYQWVSDSVKRIKEGAEYMRFEITKRGYKVFNEPNVNFIWSNMPTQELDDLEVLYKVIEGKTCITSMPRDQAERVFKFR